MPSPAPLASSLAQAAPGRRVLSALSLAHVTVEEALSPQVRPPPHLTFCDKWRCCGSVLEFMSTELSHSWQHPSIRYKDNLWPLPFSTFSFHRHLECASPWWVSWSRGVAEAQSVHLLRSMELREQIRCSNPNMNNGFLAVVSSSRKPSLIPCWGLPSVHSHSI